MTTRLLTFILSIALIALVAACGNTTADKPKEDTSFSNESAQTADLSSTEIQLIQFHSEHRCYSCQTIEELSQETLKEYPTIPFRLINIDDPENEDMAMEFEATGTALFLYNPATGEKKELTDFAFLTVGNKEKFKARLSDEIEDFYQ